MQLFDENPQVAISAVNTEENYPSALRRGRCFVYVQGSKLGMARSGSRAFQIVPVVVRANTPGGYRPVKPALFFTLVEVKEFAV